jgi:hypothetical protein
MEPAKLEAAIPVVPAAGDEKDAVVGDETHPQLYHHLKR